MHTYSALQFSLQSPNTFAPVISQSIGHKLAIGTYFHAADRLFYVLKFHDLIFKHEVPENYFALATCRGNPFIIATILLNRPNRIHLRTIDGILDFMTLECHYLVQSKDDRFNIKLPVKIGNWILYQHRNISPTIN